MDLIIGILLGVIAIVFLVVVHELGHAIAARRNGVVVEEFGIGFPPRAWSRTLKNGILFSLNWLPLGGFVRMQGEHDEASGKGDYGAATFWQKTKILLAGVLINWLTAAILLTILAMTGLPKILPNQFSLPGDTVLSTQPVEVATIVSGSPADKAGLKVHDQILRFAGVPLPAPDDLNAQTELHKGQKVEVVYSRQGSERMTSVQLRANNDDHRGYLGVTSGQREQIHATWSAPLVGIVTTAQLTGETFKGIGALVGNLFHGLFLQLSPNQAARTQAHEELAAAGSSVTGPVGILGVIFPQAQKAGVTQIVLLTAIFSLSLAVMNVLPIPALDGGRWFTMAIFRLIRQPLTKEREQKIQSVGFMVLMALIILVTFGDVSKLIR